MEDSTVRLDEAAQRAAIDLLCRLETGEQPGLEETREFLGPTEEELTARFQWTSALVGRLSRRERELLALITSTHDLVQIHDVQAVLNRLVGRAHDLVGTEVTYFSSARVPPASAGGCIVPPALGARSGAPRAVRTPPTRAAVLAGSRGPPSSGDR